MPSLSHQTRLLIHDEAERIKSSDRAKAIFEIVSLLAQAERHVTDRSLRCRIRYALEELSHVAMDGEFFEDVSGVMDVVSIARKARAS